MATFSVSAALGSGFRLIVRRPVSLLAWGLAFHILVGVPVILLFTWAAPDFFNLFHSAMDRAAQDPEHPFNPALMMPLQGKLMLLQPLLMLVTMLAGAILTGAVFRAVLEPRNRGFFGLRLGAQELWLALLGVVFAILMVLVMLAIALVCGILGVALSAALAAAHASQVWTGVAWIVVCAIGVVVMLWVLLRLSMAFPMTFAEREFRLFESWRLTKGHTWSLFFLALLLFIVLALIVVVIDLALVATVFGGLHSFADWPRHAEHFHDFFRQPRDVLLRAAAPWIAVVLIVGSWLRGALSAITLAPWASAYEGLSGGGSAPAPAWEPEPSPAPVSDHHGEDHAGHGEEPHGGHDDGHHGH